MKKVSKCYQGRVFEFFDSLVAYSHIFEVLTYFITLKKMSMLELISSFDKISKAIPINSLR